MENKEIIYAGSGKTVSGQYGEFFKVTVCLSDLPKEHIFEYNGKKYVNLTVQKKREVDQWGKTHGVSINTWKPDGNQQNNQQKPNRFEEQQSVDRDSLPF